MDRANGWRAYWRRVWRVSRQTRAAQIGAALALILGAVQPGWWSMPGVALASTWLGLAWGLAWREWCVVELAQTVLRHEARAQQAAWN